MTLYVFENQRTINWELYKSSDLVMHRTDEGNDYRVVKDRWRCACDDLIPNSDISEFITNYRQKFG